MSCRLWWALRALERQVEHEDSDVIVSKGEPASWRRREWPRILKRAGLDTGEASHAPKDLRDTFASQLLAVGVPLERIK